MASRREHIAFPELFRFLLSAQTGFFQLITKDDQEYVLPCDPQFMFLKPVSAACFWLLTVFSCPPPLLSTKQQQKEFGSFFAHTIIILSYAYFRWLRLIEEVAEFWTSTKMLLIFSYLAKRIWNAWNATTYTNTATIFIDNLEMHM